MLQGLKALDETIDEKDWQEKIKAISYSSVPCSLPSSLCVACLQEVANAYLTFVSKEDRQTQNDTHTHVLLGGVCPRLANKLNETIPLPTYESLTLYPLTLILIHSQGWVTEA